MAGRIARPIAVLVLVAAIGAALFITEKAVAKHTNNIFAKLALQASDDDNRRVLAVLRYLDR